MEITKLSYENLFEQIEKLEYDFELKKQGGSENQVEEELKQKFDELFEATRDLRIVMSDFLYKKEKGEFEIRCVHLPEFEKDIEYINRVFFNRNGDKKHIEHALLNGGMASKRTSIKEPIHWLENDIPDDIPNLEEKLLELENIILSYRNAKIIRKRYDVFRNLEENLIDTLRERIRVEDDFGSKEFETEVEHNGRLFECEVRYFYPEPEYCVDPTDEKEIEIDVELLSVECTTMGYESALHNVVGLLNSYSFA